MEFREDAKVLTEDGKTAGHIHRVVIDPDTKDVTHIVIQSGLIDKVEKAIEIQKVRTVSPDKVTLSLTADEINALQPFIIKHYAPIEDQPISYPPMVFAYPPSDLAIIFDEVRTIPKDLIALKEGTPVVSADEEHVGDVERVITHPNDNEITHFTIAKGFLHKERKLIPVGWVDKLDENEVHLSIDAETLKKLPNYGE